MRFLTSLLFILAATLFSFGAGGDAFDGFALRFGDKAIALPSSVGATATYSAKDYGFWQDLKLSSLSSYTNRQETVTNVWDEIVTYNRTVGQTWYRAQRLDVNMSNPQSYTDIYLASVVGDELRLDGLEADYEVLPRWDVASPAVNAHEGIAGNYYLDKALLERDAGIYPLDTLFSSNTFESATARIQFVSGTRTNYADRGVSRTQTWKVEGVEENTNSLRKALGGMWGFASATGYLLDYPAKVSMDNPQPPSATNDITSTINELGGYYQAAEEFDDTWIDLLAETNLFAFTGDASLSGGVLAVDRSSNAASMATITIPASYLNDPDGRYILFAIHDSISDLKYYYKVNGSTRTHENVMSSQHWVRLDRSDSDVTLDVWGGPEVPREWSKLGIVKLSSNRLLFADLGFSVRNTNCWVYGIDTTAVSTDTKPAVAIARDCVLMANHYSNGAGTTIHFVGNDNSPVERSISGIQQISVAGEATDACVGRLSQPLPESIGNAVFFPSNYRDYLPAGMYSLPMLAIGKYRDARIVYGVIDQVQSYAPQWGKFGTLGQPMTKPYLTDLGGPPDISAHINYWEGFSGSPVAMPIGGRLALATMMTTSSTGPSYSDMLPEIQAAMAALGSTNQIETINLGSVYP